MIKRSIINNLHPVWFYLDGLNIFETGSVQSQRNTQIRREKASVKTTDTEWVTQEIIVYNICMYISREKVERKSERERDRDRHSDRDREKERGICT